MLSSLFGVLSLFRPQPVVLNQISGHQTPQTTEDPLQLIGDLKKSMLQLKVKFMDEKGERVNYSAMRGSEEFLHYKELAMRLPSIDLASLPSYARKALFINTYNCLILHGLVENQLTSYDTLSRLRFYATSSYRIGKQVFSLNDIENGILRGNRRSPVPLSSKPFMSEDPRLKYALPCDPRVHFALNCAAESCPPIAVYSFEEQGLEDQLALATQAFLASTIHIDSSKSCVTLSMLFKWYGDDFGASDGDRLNWVADHCDAELASQLRSFLASCPSFKIKYSPYSWNLNG